MTLEQACENLKKLRATLTATKSLDKFFNWGRDLSGLNWSGLSQTSIYPGLLMKLSKAMEKGKDAKDYINEIKKVKRLQEAAGKFQEYLENGVPLVNSLHNVDGDTRFKNCTWFFYYYNYIPRAGGHCVLSRAILTVEHDGLTARLKAKSHNNEEEEYKGELHNIWNKRLVTFELTGLTYGKRLYLQAFLGAKPQEIALGLFLTPDFDGLSSGTFVLHLIQNKPLINLKPLSSTYILNGKDFNDIPLAVRRFLSFKNQNYLTIPRGVYTMNGLLERIKEYRPNRSALFFSEEKPIVFISSPCEAISKKEHEVNKKYILYLKGYLEKFFPDLIIKYPGEKRRNDNNDPSLIDNLNVIKRTTYFIFISSGSQKSSTSMIELSWALAFSKVAFLCYKDGAIPERLPRLINDTRIAYLEPFLFDLLQDDIEDICEFIKNRIRWYRNKNVGLQL